MHICKLLDLGPGGVWESTHKFSAKSVEGNGPFCKKCVFAQNGKNSPKSDFRLSEGLKCPTEVRVEHKTYSTICATPVQAILDQNNLTGLGGGVREGQNNALVHMAH